MSMQQVLVGLGGSSETPVSVPTANVILNFNGTDGSTTFTDEGTGGHVWTAGGTPTPEIDTAQQKFGSASFLRPNGTGRITAPSHADFAMGTGDYTLACWVRQTLNTSSQNIFMVNTGNGIQFNLVDGKLRLGLEGVAWDYTAASAMSLNVWHHLAICRASGTVYGFVDGVVVWSGASTRNYAQGIASIGAKSGGSEGLNGSWIDSFLYVKGTALYTSAFTPPAGPYAP